MDLDDILNDPPKPHEDLGGGFMVMGLTEAALRFIYDNIDDHCSTIETGCGLSTVVFALTGSRHTVIAPAPTEFEITKNYCKEHGIPTNQITFVCRPSQVVLPALDLPPLDLVLIDGGHGFPTPYIDWFYTAGKLKKDGYLIVDDVGLWTCQVLHDFLMEQPQWEFVAEYETRTAIFRKKDEGSEWLEWTQQPRVARGGRVKWINGQLHWEMPNSSYNSATVKRVISELRNGNFRGLAKKMRSKIFPS